jgi:hypothetical protein
MTESDLDHPGYDSWLIKCRMREQQTGQLLHALVNRSVRASLYRSWRAERCNPTTPYNDHVDDLMSCRCADVLEERIAVAERGLPESMRDAVRAAWRARHHGPE